MSDPDHVRMIELGADVWNRWRAGNPGWRPDLSSACVVGSLRGFDLDTADLRNADLSGALLDDTTSLVGARENEATRWPPNFRLSGRGLSHERGVAEATSLGEAVSAFSTTATPRAEARLADDHDGDEMPSDPKLGPNDVSVVAEVTTGVMPVALAGRTQALSGSSGALTVSGGNGELTSPESDVALLEAIRHLLPADVEERQSFELLWDIIEQALNDRELDAAVEHDVRNVRQQIDLVRQLATVDNNDMLQASARTLFRLVPHLFEPLPTEVRDAGLQLVAIVADPAATIEERVQAVNEGLAIATELIARAIPAHPVQPTVTPLSDDDSQWAAAADRHAKHLARTLDAWTPFCQTVQVVWNLPIVRAGRWTLATSTAAIAGMAGGPVGGAAAAGGFIVAALAKWAYGLARRESGHLPGLPQTEPRERPDTDELVP